MHRAARIIASILVIFLIADSAGALDVSPVPFLQPKSWRQPRLPIAMASDAHKWRFASAFPTQRPAHSFIRTPDTAGSVSDYQQ